MLTASLELLTIGRSDVHPTLKHIIGLDHLSKLHTLTLLGEGCRHRMRPRTELQINAASPEGQIFPPALFKIEMVCCHVLSSMDKIWPSSIVGLCLERCHFDPDLPEFSRELGRVPECEELTVFPPLLEKLDWYIALPIDPKTRFPKT